MDRLALLVCLAIATTSGGVAAADESPLRSIELPEVGIALSLPADWDVAVPMIDTTDQARGAWRGSALGGLDDVRTYLALDATNGLDYPQPGSGGCFLGASVAAESIDETLDLDEILLVADEGALWTDPGFELTAEAELRLPIGRVNRVDFVEHDDDGDWFGIGYRFVIPDGLGWLQCVGFEGRPDDGWLDLVETLELLPTGPMPAPSDQLELQDTWDVRVPVQSVASAASLCLSLNTQETSSSP